MNEQSGPANAEDKRKGIGNQFFSRLYEELHRVAERELRRNSAAKLRPTTLLHETFLNLSQRELGEFSDRAHHRSFVPKQPAEARFSV